MEPLAPDKGGVAPDEWHVALAAIVQNQGSERAALVGSRLGSDHGADGGFAPFVKNLCRSVTERVSLYQSERGAPSLKQARSGNAG